MSEPRIIETAQDDGIACPNYVRAFLHQQVKAVDADTRTITHLITTDSVDRAGDIVEPNGVVLDNYRKNPVVMVDHDYRTEKIVGRARMIEVDDNSIAATTEFRDTPLAVDSFNLASEGLGGWSIGFRPTERHYIRDGAQAGCPRCKTEMERATKGKKPSEKVNEGYGLHFTKWEMLEYSIVAIPANQDIVNDAVKRGLVAPDRADVFFRSRESKPPEGASQGSNAETRELHPALTDALTRARRKVSFSIQARAITEALRNLRHGQ